MPDDSSSGGRPKLLNLHLADGLRLQGLDASGSNMTVGRSSSHKLALIYELFPPRSQMGTSGFSTVGILAMADGGRNIVDGT